MRKDTFTQSSTVLRDPVLIGRRSWPLAFVLTALVALVLTPGIAGASFGIQAFDQQILANAQGDPFTQAGGHPYAIVTEVDFNHHEDVNTHEGANRPDADVKDVIAELPPGLVGNPTAAPQCTQAQLSAAGGKPTCPTDAIVGTIQLRTTLSEEHEVLFRTRSFMVPVYNMVPPVDAPAAFGFRIANVAFLIEGKLRNGGDFGVVLRQLNIPAALPINGFTLTFWGVPADGSHDFQRCSTFLFGYLKETMGCDEGTSEHATVAPQAFLTTPVSCSSTSSGLLTRLKVDSWVDPGAFAEQELFSHVPPGYPSPLAEWGARQGTTGCDLVPFQPSVNVTPSVPQADTPSGLNVDVSLPQDGVSNPAGLATSDVRKAVVQLPAGVAVSPSAASGLEACSPAQIGLNTGEPPSCPSASKLGTVEITTPLQSDALHGFVYLAKQNDNPFNTLLALYLVAEGHGVVLKLPGKVEMDPQTGQLTTTFDNSPQLPFDDLKISFNGGSRAPLVNPHFCGTYTTTGRFTSWSSETPVETSSSFQITSGPHGGPCPTSGSAFSPSLQAGTTNIQAGAFSPFTLAFSRNDGEQQLGELQIKTPPGLLGTLSNVPLCPEPLAATGDCPEASQIGSMVVGAGAGATPVYVHGGKIYLTGSYKGSQFGLSIVQEAVAGPFDLGRVVVRGQITVDPHTASLTISSDPLPTSLQGIPLDLRVVSVSIDRPNFTFNPTNCNPMQITGTLTSGQGASETVGSPFQVTNCQILGFKPKFTVSTSGHTSRANGASLDTKIVYPKAGLQANIAKVKVSLPKQLPSRLTTLQKACPAATFNTDPSTCPAGSVVGIVRAVTPILPVTLTGPVYFVSHGGEAFPNLIIVLQGYGVRVDLVGTTFISKAGITSSTFSTVPDVPIGSFELYLPQGPHSALAANGNLCKSKLVMPTSFVAQNGMTLKQNTQIKATGCTTRAAKTTRVTRRARTASKHDHTNPGRNK